MIEAFRYGDAVTINCVQNTTLSDPSVRVVRLTGTLEAERTLLVPVRAGADYDVIVDTVDYGVNFGPGVHLAVGDRARVVHDGTGWKAVTLSTAQALDIDALEVKTSPVDADLIIIGDSDDSNLPKRTTIAQIKDGFESLAGEVSGPIGVTVVSKIRGYGFSEDTPAAGDALVVSGGDWTPTAVVTQAQYDEEVPPVISALETIIPGLVGTTFPTVFTTDHNSVRAKWTLGGDAFCGEQIATAARDIAITGTHPHLLTETPSGASALVLNSADDWDFYPTSESWKTILVGTWKTYNAWNGATDVYRHLIDDWKPRLQQDQSYKLAQNNVKKLSYLEHYTSGGDYYCRFGIEGTNYALISTGIAFAVSSSGGVVGSYEPVYEPVYLASDDLARASNLSGALQSVPVGNYFAVHVFAHSSGRISVNGTSFSTDIEDIVYSIRSDMRAVHAYCNNTALTASTSTGVLTTNMVPLCSLIYLQNEGSVTLQSYDGVEIYDYIQPVNDDGSKKSALVKYQYSNIDSYGVTSSSSSKVRLDIKTGATVESFAIDACQYLLGTTGNIGGAINSRGVIGVNGIVTAADYFRLFIPIPANAQSSAYMKLSFDAHKRIGGAHTHYSAVYDFAVSSTETDLSLLSSVGTTPFSAPVVATSGDFYTVTFSTASTVTELIVLGTIELCEWKIYTT